MSHRPPSASVLDHFWAFRVRQPSRVYYIRCEMLLLYKWHYDPATGTFLGDPDFRTWIVSGLPLRNRRRLPETPGMVAMILSFHVPMQAQLALVRLDLDWRRGGSYLGSPAIT